MKSAVVIDCVRTPIGRSHKERGWFRDVRSDDLAVACLKALIERTGIDPALVEDVVLGNTQQTGEQSLNAARTIGLMAGLSVEAGGTTVNRLCGSSLQALNQASHAIAAGAAILGASMSADVDAKACRKGSPRLAVCVGSNDASANLVTVSRSCLPSRFATGLLTTGEAMSALAAGTLSRPRMLMAAAPAMRKQVSAMMVMALVKRCSVRAFEPNHFCENWATIEA